MKNIISTVLLTLSFFCSVAQKTSSWKSEYKSVSNPYSITIPKTFKKTDAKRTNIDLKFIDDYGSSILINVTSRRSDEYSISAHDYSKEMLVNAFRGAAPNYIISYSEKIFINGQKAFLTESSGGVSSKLKTMECYIYYKNKAYVITGSALINKFSNYRQLFKSAIKSMKFF